MNKFILSIVLIIVAIGLTLSYTRSEYQVYQTLKAEAESYETALQQADELAELRNDLQEQLESIDAQKRDRLEKFLPRNIDTVRLTIEVSSIADTTGIEIEEFSFADTTTSNESSDSENSEDTGDDTSSIQSGADYSSVDMTLSATGNYDEFKNFLTRLENNLRLTDIQSVTVDNSENANSESGTNLNNYQVVLRTYWLGT
jgi:Tfp pilus assembly protein PilO